jgi:hypothetical protein
MRKRSPLTLLLLALLLTASYVAMSAHEVGHAMGPDDIRQCTLCVKGTQPFTMPVLNKIPELLVLEYYLVYPASTYCPQSKGTYQDQNPRAPPSIA